MRLSNSVDDYLKKYGGYLVNDNVKNGMDIEVKYTHQFGNDRSGDVAELADTRSDVPTDTNPHVELSAAFCQILWLMLYYALNHIDKEIIAKQCEIKNPDKKHQLRQIISSGELSAMPGINKEEKAMLNYMRNVLNSDDGHILSTVENFLPRLKNGHLSYREMLELHCEFPMNDVYDLMVNGAYSFGVVFILFHEHGHYSNENSLSKAEIRNNAMVLEYSADIVAMLNAIESTDEHSRELKSFCIGAIGAILCSRWIGSDIPDDGIHPDEFDRLDKIVGEVERSGKLNDEEMAKLHHVLEQWKLLFASL